MYTDVTAETWNNMPMLRLQTFNPFAEQEEYVEVNTGLAGSGSPRNLLQAFAGMVTPYITLSNYYGTVYYRNADSQRHGGVPPWTYEGVFHTNPDDNYFNYPGYFVGYSSIPFVGDGLYAWDVNPEWLVRWLLDNGY